MSDLISKMQKVANQLDSHNHFDEANYITSLMTKIAQANTGFGGSPAVKPLSFDEDFYQNLPTTETYNPSDPSKPSDTPDAVQNLQDYQRQKPEILSIENDFATRSAKVMAYITLIGKTKKFEMMEYLMGILVYFISDGKAEYKGTNKFPNKDVLGTHSQIVEKIGFLKNAEIQNKVNEFILSEIQKIQNKANELTRQANFDYLNTDDFEQFKYMLDLKFKQAKSYFDINVNEDTKIDLQKSSLPQKRDDIFPMYRRENK